MSTLNTSRLETLREHIRSLQTTPPPAPWKAIANIAVGGLTCVGFDRDSELLLVVSSRGRGVFDCLDGQRVARDRGDYEEDYAHLEAQGIGPLQGRAVRVAGIAGGGLPTSTADGWALHRLELDWPAQELVLTEPGSHLFGELYDRPASLHKIHSDSTVRACGFSATGRSLVIATSSELLIFARG